MGKLIPKKEFVEQFLEYLTDKNKGKNIKTDIYEPVVRSGVSRDETVKLVQEICKAGELSVDSENLAIALKAVPFHTVVDVYDIVHKFEINKARLRTNAILFVVTVGLIFLSTFFLVKVNLILSLLLSSLGSGIITFVRDNIENPGAIPSSDL